MHNRFGGRGALAYARASETLWNQQRAPNPVKHPARRSRLTWQLSLEEHYENPACQHPADWQGDALVLRRPASPVRAGWAEAARMIAANRDDELVMGEFGNADDQGLIW